MNGHSALLATMPLDAGIDEAIRRYKPFKVEVVTRNKNHAVLRYV